MKTNKSILFILVISIFMIPLVSAGFESASRIPVTSDFPQLNKPNGLWVVKFTSDPYATDRLFTSLNAGSDLPNAKQGLTISSSPTLNYCQYDIKREASRLDVLTYDIVSKQQTYYTWSVTASQLEATAKQWAIDLGCSDLTGNTFNMDISAGSKIIGQGLIHTVLAVYCYKQKDNVGKIGSLQNLFYGTQTIWSVQASGKSVESTTISNDASGSGVTGRIGDDVYIRFGGLLSSGMTCPITATERMAYNPTFTGNWRIIDEGNYRLYEDYMSDQNSRSHDATAVACKELSSLSICKNQPTMSKDSVVTQINNKAYKAIEQRNIDYTPIISQATEQFGKLKLDLARQIMYPSFTLFIDTDYLEVNIPTGVPTLSCPRSIKWTEGDLHAGQLQVQVGNTGSGEGGFQLRVLNCNSANFGAGDSQTFRLSPGDSQSKTLLITGISQAGQKVSGTCTIEMKETTTQVTKTCSVGVEVSAPAICDEGKKICSYDSSGTAVIKQCINNVQKIITTCPADKPVCDSNGLDLFCRASSECPKGEQRCADNVCRVDCGGKCAWWNLPCHIKNLFILLGNILTVIKWIVLVTLSIFSWIISKNFIEDKLIRNRKDKAFVYVLASLVGIAVAIGLYLVLLTSLFWILVIGLIIFFAITKFIPRFRR